MTIPLGQHCHACNATEPDCARIGTCCPMCSHFRHLDSQGNDVRQPGRPSRRLDAQHGTEAGYQRHRYLNDTTCLDCRRAHNAYNARQTA